MKDDLVEAVARALCKADGYDPDRLNNWEYQWMFYAKEARAAIAAARPAIRREALEEAAKDWDRRGIMRKMWSAANVAADLRALGEKP